MLGYLTLRTGAGNQAAVVALDLLHRLLYQDSVVVVKMNPVNDNLGPHMEAIFKPFIQMDAVAFVYGGSEVSCCVSLFGLLASHITCKSDVGSERRVLLRSICLVLSARGYPQRHFAVLARRPWQSSTEHCSGQITCRIVALYCKHDHQRIAGGPGPNAPPFGILRTLDRQPGNVRKDGMGRNSAASGGSARFAKARNG